MRVRYGSRLERLIANTIVDDDGCWIWFGRKDKDGYGLMAERVEGKEHPVAIRVHRAMLEEWHGYYFPHDEAGHAICYKPACIRPDCLEIQAPAHNLAERRGYAAPKDGKRWIPVLYPTPAREEAERIDAFLDAYFAGKTGRKGKICPF